jgi:uncharacterized protein YycO
MTMRTESAQKKTETPKTIDFQSLVAGDIIGTKADTLNSKGVRFFTSGRLSHAILYTAGNMGAKRAVDAMPEKGVTEEPLWQKMQSVSYAAVFRHRTATPEQRERACQWARMQAVLHKHYDYNSAARVGSSLLTGVGRLIIASDELSAKREPEGEDASFMCSELVFRAYEIAGAPLTKKPAHCVSPGMLFRTDRLEYMGEITYKRS